MVILYQRRARDNISRKILYACVRVCVYVCVYAGPLISGVNHTSPRASLPLPLSANALILGDWKLLTGKVGESGWTGWIYPNATTAAGAKDVRPAGLVLHL